MNRGGAALHSGASRADIMAPIAQSRGDGASGGAGRKLDCYFLGQYGAHVPMCAILTDSSARELAKSEVGTPLSRDGRGFQSVCSGSSDQEGSRTGCFFGGAFFLSEHLHSQYGAKALPLLAVPGMIKGA